MAYCVSQHVYGCLICKYFVPLTNAFNAPFLIRSSCCCQAVKRKFKPRLSDYAIKRM